MVKTYVLDTNILLSTEGRVIFGFDDNDVVITHTTMEELDLKKEVGGEVGYQARECIRILIRLLENKKKDETIIDGIHLESGGTLRLVTNHLDSKMPKGWSLDRADNRILCTTKTLADSSESKVILITNDGNMRFKASMLEVDAQSYQNDQTVEDEFYTGRVTIENVDKTMVTDMFREHNLDIERVDKDINLNENEFITIKDYNNGSVLGWKKGNTIKHISSEDKTVFGITSKNTGQRFALEALLAPVDEIPLVILKGPAGCGKTLLSLAAGLDGSYDSKKTRLYDKVVITRSNTLSDEDLGFLPGDLEDKMAPLLAPFFDNLKFLIGKNIEEKAQVNIQIEDMIEEGVIEITSLSYIRGRSLTNTFLIVDEAQNLTRLQAKTIVTRMGMGSKLVILGDPNQIDNPKLDKKNNGLAYLSEKFKDSPLCAQVEFTNKESVRSKLAIEAINRL